MRSTIVPVQNVLNLSIAGNNLINRPYGTPGLGLIYGRPGLGKTTAVTWFVNQVNGIYVRAMRCCTPLSLLLDICAELNVRDPSEPGSAPRFEMPRNSRDAVHVITKIMAEDERPLFIDEADYLMGREDLVETVRDIHDVSTVPVILIGMDKINTNIESYPQFAGRVMEWVEFKSCQLGDARKIVDDMCDEFQVADDLLIDLVEAAKGEIRRIVTGLHQLEKQAKSKKLAVMTKRDFTGKFSLGHKPG